MADLESVVFGALCNAFGAVEAVSKKGYLAVSNEEPFEGAMYFVYRLNPQTKSFEKITTSNVMKVETIDENVRLVETQNSVYFTMLGGAREGKTHFMATQTIPKAGYRVDGIKLLVNGKWTEWHTTKAIHVYDHNGVYDVETLNSRYYVVVAE